MFEISKKGTRSAKSQKPACQKQQRKYLLEVQYKDILLNVEAIHLVQPLQCCIVTISVSPNSPNFLCLWVKTAAFA